jgi:hypothetical protein
MTTATASRSRSAQILWSIFLIFTLAVSARCEPISMKTNAFAEVFNDVAKRASVDKSATLQECRKVIFSACLYSISDNTKIVVGGKADDSPRSITIITLRKGETIPKVFGEEDAEIWPLIVQIANPDSPTDQRTLLIDKFNAMVKADQPTFTTKIGSIRYSAAAAPEMGIWMIANLKPVLSPSTWFGDWQQKVKGWMAKVRTK